MRELAVKIGFRIILPIVLVAQTCAFLWSLWRVLSALFS